jgi:hypothetical protein
MEHYGSLVMTSIQGADHPVLRTYASLCAGKGLDFIVAGDTRSPDSFRLEGCEFLGISEQKQLPFRLAGLLPDRNYAKKNLAYLQAIRKGHSMIIETDDDNIPAAGFWDPRQAEVSGRLDHSGSWTNVYRYFSAQPIWPRGFSLRHVKTPSAAPDMRLETCFSPIQQTLVDDNPDVDAIYRLCLELPFRFLPGEPVILEKGSICPFNSQNTTWFKPAFPLLYLPSYCSFRMCDIWRSFIAQRVLWTTGWRLSFHPANARQQRNEHDLIQDFEEEIDGYLHNHTIVDGLRALHLKEGAGHLHDNLKRCYEWMSAQGYLDPKELPLLEAWLLDLKDLEGTPADQV